MYNDITDYFLELLDQSGSYDIAHAEFLHRLDDDPELSEQYAEWCDSMGYSVRDGFDRYCQDHFDSRNEMWDSLNDYDE